MAVELLGELGYTVLPAGGPGEAIALCERGVEVDLLLTDVVMPAMNGKQLADRIRTLRPAIRVLFMSGYTANAVGHRGVLEGGIDFLEKPFTLDALASKVREVLDQES